MLNSEPCGLWFSLFHTIFVVDSLFLNFLTLYYSSALVYFLSSFTIHFPLNHFSLIPGSPFCFSVIAKRNNYPASLPIQYIHTNTSLAGWLSQYIDDPVVGIGRSTFDSRRRSKYILSPVFSPFNIKFGTVVSLPEIKR